MAAPIAAAARASASRSGTAAVRAGAQGATQQILRIAWTSVIPTFGLSLLYVNFHFIARYFAHAESFAAFGSEWGGPARVAAHPSAALEYAEIGALLALDFLVAVLLFVLAMTLGLVAFAIADPCGFFTTVGPTISAMFGPTGIAAWAGCAGAGALGL